MSRELLKEIAEVFRERRGGITWVAEPLLEKIEAELTQPESLMTKSLNDLLDDYGDACYSNTDEAWAVRREITKLFDSRQKQKPIACITGWYGGYPTIKILDGAVLPNGTPLYAAPPERKSLSNEEIEWIRIRTLGESEGPLHLNFHERFARAIETAHGITP